MEAVERLQRSVELANEWARKWVAQGEMKMAYACWNWCKRFEDELGRLTNGAKR